MHLAYINSMLDNTRVAQPSSAVLITKISRVGAGIHACGDRLVERSRPRLRRNHESGKFALKRDSLSGLPNAISLQAGF